jgi:hypothetical protein
MLLLPLMCSYSCSFVMCVGALVRFAIEDSRWIKKEKYHPCFQALG